MLPHDAGEDLLRHALAAAAVVTRTGLARSFTAWLPTKGMAALPSSVLVSDDAEPDTRAPAKPWTVTAIPLSPGHAIALLRAAAEKPLIAPGLAGGDDLRFFGSVLRFAAGLVASGHFVPGIARDSAALPCTVGSLPAGGDRARLHAARAGGASGRASPRRPERPRRA